MSRPFLPGSKLSRRLLGAGALAALPAILSRPARAAGSVTVAGFGDWFQHGFDGIILSAFRRAHPGIQVFYYPVGSSFQILGMLRAQRAVPSTDLVLLEAGAAARGKVERLLEPLDAGTLPVMKDLLPRSIRPELPGPALMIDSLALGYNPSRMHVAPRLWRNLWDPGYAKQIGLQTPPDSIGLATTAVAAGLFGNGNPSTSLEIALTALSGLAPRVTAWDPLPDIYTAIAVGDAAIGPCWNARGQAQAAKTADRFAAIIPNEGSPYLPTTINLVKGSPQADAARVLVAWLLSPDAQRLIAEAMFYAPVNTKVALPPAVVAKVGATPEIAGKRMEVDWVRITAMQDEITEAWRQKDLEAQ